MKEYGRARLLVSTDEYIKQMVEDNYKEDNCSSRSEYVSKAIEYYTGQLATQKNDQFISTKVASLLRSLIKESEHKTEKIVFKLAVEIAMMMHLIARSQNVSQEDLDWLRSKSIDDIKGTNGTLKFDDIFWWFRG
jgi:metal-responsive CopG/Arc/MetJ family transcriptional regulator